MPAGVNAYAAAANPFTKKIYAANLGDDTVTVINGVTNATKSIPVGTVNAATQTIYTGNLIRNDVTAINGKTFTTKTAAISA